MKRNEDVNPGYKLRAHPTAVQQALPAGPQQAETPPEN
jgi:hypothetical protein